MVLCVDHIVRGGAETAASEYAHSLSSPAERIGAPSSGSGLIETVTSPVRKVSKFGGENGVSRFRVCRYRAD